MNNRVIQYKNRSYFTDGFGSLPEDAIRAGTGVYDGIERRFREHPREHFLLMLRTSHSSWTYLFGTIEKHQRTDTDIDDPAVGFVGERYFFGYHSANARSQVSPGRPSSGLENVAQAFCSLFDMLVLELDSVKQ
ncbi:MAG TPA: hypothetical protein VN420_05665 [Candidatus Fimivivens sp.]|nr:hypothetical protein [Candidatus Fimivivens sp.]